MNKSTFDITEKDATEEKIENTDHQTGQSISYSYEKKLVLDSTTLDPKGYLETNRKSHLSWPKDRSPSSKKLQKTYTTCIVILTVLAILASLYYAKEILIPITIAWFLSMLLSPIVRLGKRYKIPQPLTASIIVIFFILAFTSVINLLVEPASHWFHQLPEKIESIQEKLYVVQAPLTDLQEVGDQVVQLTTTAEDSPSISVAIQESSWVNILITDHVPVISSSIIIISVLTFFLLSSSDRFLRQAVKVGSTWNTKKLVVRTMTSIRKDLSIYLATFSIINLILGISVGLALSYLELPNPFFWGIVAGLLNFAPYIGPIITACLLMLAGMTTFDTLSASLLPAGVFIIISTVEGQIITPTILGKRLSLSPTAIFIAVIFWTWLWGIAGALMAAPILASIKILCENVPSFNHYKYLIEK